MSKALLLLCCLLAPIIPPVLSAFEPGRYVIKSVAYPDQVLDLNREENTVNGWGANGGNNQRWDVEPNSEDGTTYTIQNVDTHQYANQTGTRIVASNEAYFWSLSTDDDDKTRILQNLDSTNYAFELSGSNDGDAVTFDVQTDKDNQKWVFERSEDAQ